MAAVTLEGVTAEGQGHDTEAPITTTTTWLLESTRADRHQPKLLPRYKAKLELKYLSRISYTRDGESERVGNTMWVRKIREKCSVVAAA